MSAYRFSLAQLAALARAVPDPADAALFATARQELVARLRRGEYPAEEAAAWGRVLEQLEDLEQATRRLRQEE
jgi:uncharacterized membrane protein YccC